MSKVAIQGNASGTGTFTIAAPNSNTDRTLTLPDSAGTIATTNGITMADQWYLSSNFGISTSATVVNSGWARTTAQADAGTIGSAMTESSGVFTFPSTGLYLINLQVRFLSDNGNDLYAYASLQITTNNSSYTNRVSPIDNFYATNSYGSSSGMIIFDVTDTSTHKVRVLTQTQSLNGNLSGGTERHTALTFLKLGET